MTLKFDTKLMKVADEFADFDLLKPKAQPGPHFHTQETESMFIVTVQLKGYTQKNIKVEINEDGSRITISGKKPFKDMMLVGGNVVKKDTEMRGFQKSFKLPQGVVSDLINVRFIEDDSELVIQMLKVTKGLTGGRIEELKVEEVLTGPTKLLKIYTNEELLKEEARGVRHDNSQGEFSANSKEDDKTPKSCRRRFKMCTPLIFGSAFVMSLIVLAFHMVELKKQETQQKKKKQD